MLNKKEQRLRRSRQTRERIAKQGVARLTVFRSNLHIYASVISDDGSKVLASASTAEKEVREQLGAAGKGANTAAATIIGKRIAEKAKAAGIKVATPTQTEIVITGPDRQVVGQLAAEVRAFRPPEPYKGKGIRYVGERVVIKETKKK